MLHSYIGCDYISSFYGKGKANALELARANEQFRSAFSDLGTSEVVCEETVSKLNVFTCHLFCDRTGTTVNDAREDCLPPNKDACTSIAYKSCQLRIIHLAQMYKPKYRRPQLLKPWLASG